jgi:hypothetical protein
VEACIRAGLVGVSALVAPSLIKERMVIIIPTIEAAASLL